MRNLLLSFILLSLLLSILFNSCSREDETDRLLYRMHMLLKTKPDSALTILEAMDPARLKGKRQHALHALLLAYARDKNYIGDKDDSLTRIAVEYFDKTDEIEYKQRAHYYHAMVLANGRRINKALPEAIKGYELALEADSPVWIATSADQIASFNSVTYNYREALKYWDIAIKYYEMEKMDIHLFFAKFLKAEVLRLSGRPNEALDLLDSVSREYPQVRDDQKYVFNTYLLTLLVYLKKWDRAKNVVEYLLQPKYKDYRKYLYVSDYWSISEVYLRDNKKDEVAKILADLKGTEMVLSEKLFYSLINYQYQSLYGDFESLKEAMDSMIVASDIFKRKEISTSVATEEVRYNQLKRAEAEKLSRIKSKLLYLSLAAFLLITVIIIMVLYYKRIRRKEAIEKIFSRCHNSSVVFELNKEQFLSFLGNLKLSDSAGDRSHLYASDNSEPENQEESTTDVTAPASHINDTPDESIAEELIQLRDFLSDNLEKDLKEIENLSRDYLENVNKISYAETVRQIYNRINQIRNSDTFRRIDQYNEVMYGRSLNGIYSSGILNDNEIMLLRLSAAGISRNAICLLTDISYSNFYTIRKRIIDKLTAAEIPEKEIAITIITEYLQKQKEKIHRSGK